jgi:hypothetical protein
MIGVGKGERESLFAYFIEKGVGALDFELCIGV